MRCQASCSWPSSSGGPAAGCSGSGCLPPARAAAARRRARRLRSRRARGCGAVPTAGSLLELLEPEGDRLAGEVDARARHLHERELEREPRVAALAHVVDGHGEEVAQAEHRRLRQLVRLLAQPLARLVGDGQRVGHVSHVLDEQEVAEMLEQVGDEPAEILALLGELLDLDERAGGVAVDDGVAEAEERVLLDGAEQLQHRLHVDRVAGRGRELVERRLRVAERARARRARSARARRPAPRSPPRRRRAAARGRAPTAAGARRRTSGSASARSAAPWPGRWCRRRRRGAAAAPRSASAARSRRRR